MAANSKTITATTIRMAAMYFEYGFSSITVGTDVFITNPVNACNCDFLPLDNPLATGTKFYRK
jgi:hypothetical protein